MLSQFALGFLLTLFPVRLKTKFILSSGFCLFTIFLPEQNTGTSAFCIPLLHSPLLCVVLEERKFIFKGTVIWLFV